jgi:hypothetical protein
MVHGVKLALQGERFVRRPAQKFAQREGQQP